ncbi:MAG: hypothetical protein IT215_08785, partial [Chitinophagaceae bacterium]|nr:hypothetical protein [Chitinophagaceae bacterium]
MYFKASLDLASKIITWSLTGFILVYSFLLKDINPLILLPILIILPILIFTYLYQPLGYEITIDYIEIHRRVNKFYIPRNEIESVMVLHHNELGRTWRTMGNGGLFGYTGYYNSSKFGNM